MISYLNSIGTSKDIFRDIIVENHETRKQRDNRERAMLILKSILYKKELDRKNKAAKELEDSESQSTDNEFDY